jgi:hypothetical protein
VAHRAGSVDAPVRVWVHLELLNCELDQALRRRELLVNALGITSAGPDARAAGPDVPLPDPKRLRVISEATNS